MLIYIGITIELYIKDYWKSLDIYSCKYIIKLSFSFSFTIRFTFTNLSFLRAKNWLSFKIIILLVYILMIPNGVPIVIIRK